MSQLTVMAVGRKLPHSPNYEVTTADDFDELAQAMNTATGPLYDEYIDSIAPDPDWRFLTIDEVYHD